jgi:hypothetical protein
MTAGDNLDWDAIGAAMKDAIKKSRGYASWWEYALVPRLGEHHAASVLTRFLFGEGPVDALMFPDQDPPDVVLPLASGRRIGIEVTEIIDPKAVEMARFLKRKRDGWSPKDLVLAGWPWAEWPDDQLSDSLLKATSTKDRKLARVAAGYDELYLAMITDEPDIDAEKAARVVSALGAPAASIDRAFLMLGYNPGVDKTDYPDGCPVFELRLSRSPNHAGEQAL